MRLKLIVLSKILNLTLDNTKTINCKYEGVIALKAESVLNVK